MGIGRPSTFSSIVETIQDRGYVKRCDTEGKTISCKEFNLQSDVLTYTLEDKVFGREKNKLIIQNIGVLTLEFLIKYFSDIFAYDYTRNMESALDILAQPSNTLFWHNLCRQCYNQIKTLSKPISKLEKQLFKIDEEHDVVYISGKHVLRKIMEDGTIEFKTIKSGLKLDLEKLKNGEYTLDDLLEIKQDYLGKYRDHNVYLKSGKYGNYIQWGDNRASIKNITKDINTITFEDVIGHIYSHEGIDITQLGCTENENQDGLPPNIRHPAPPPTSSTILRTIDDSLSIRKGKYGPYIFYKTPFMKTPTFYNLTPKYKKSYNTCSLDELKSFIREKYNIAMN
jgi:DNA topoisomerase-1